MRTASFVGQYIHCAFYTHPTIKDGDVVIFIAIDNYSAFAYKPLLVKVFNMQAAHTFLVNVLDELHTIHPHVKPNFIMSFGKSFWKELENAVGKKAALFYEPDEANRITLPVIEMMMKKMSL